MRIFAKLKVVVEYEIEYDDHLRKEEVTAEHLKDAIHNEYIVAIPEYEVKN